MVRPAPLLLAAAAEWTAAAAAVAAVAAVAAAGCSSKARPDGAGSAAGGAGGGGTGAGSGGSGGSAGAAAAGSAGAAAVGSAGASGSGAASPGASQKPGEVQIRVEWADVPTAARASPGRTPCNTPRAPSVEPTPGWGIPDVLVIVEGARADAAEARIVLADCALSPRVAVGSSLLVESAADRPATVTLAKPFELAIPAAALPFTSSGGAPRVLRLPIAGHAVAVPLDAGGIYELSTADKAPEIAWIVAPRAGAAIAVTDADGQVTLRNVPPGSHAVTAWLPPRASQPARIARGTLTPAAGGLTELSIRLLPVP